MRLFLIDLWSQLDEVFFQLFYDDVGLGKPSKALLEPCDSNWDILLLSLELSHEGVHEFQIAGGCHIVFAPQFIVEILGGGSDCLMQID